MLQLYQCACMCIAIVHEYADLRCDVGCLLFSCFHACRSLVCPSVTFGEQTRDMINDSTTFDDSSHYLSPLEKVQDSGTTHISVLDPSGLAVSITR